MLMFLLQVQSLKMLVIQPKKFQECNITYQPDSLMYKGVVVTENVVEQLVDLKNGEILHEVGFSKCFSMLRLFIGTIFVAGCASGGKNTRARRLAEFSDAVNPTTAA